jgi:hypothetical protein
LAICSKSPPFRISTSRESLLQHALALFVGGGDLGIADRDRLCLLSQLRERFLLETLTAVLVDESLPIFFRRSESRAPKLRAIFLIRLELLAHRLELAVRGGCDIDLACLQLELFSFLDEELLVNEVVQHRPRDGELTGGVRRNREPLRAALVHGGENVAPKNRLIANDSDDAVDGHISRGKSDRGRHALRSRGGRSECENQ